MSAFFAWAKATCAFALFLSITMSDAPIKLFLKTEYL
jgi:hypothetical protein